MVNDKVTSGRRAKKLSQVSSKFKVLIIIGIVAIGSILGITGFLVYDYVTSQAQGPTPSAITTVSMSDWTSKEDLGELCPFTLYGDKGKITATEHIYDITYYETVSTEVMPDDFSKDLSEYDYLIFRVNPDEATDGYWTTYDYVFPNAGNNFDFDLFGYHEATDLYGNVLNVVGGDEFDKSTSGNYTISLWFPSVTKTELHRGTHYDITDDLADLSQKTLDKLWNEKYYRNMPTLFSLADDIADHTKIGDYAMITETFAIEIDFNATISSTDAATTQVNFTADCDLDFLIEIDDDALYFVSTESWDTLIENFEMFFEISMGTHILVSSIKAGRVVIPDRFFGTGYTFSSLQTLA